MTKSFPLSTKKIRGIALIIRRMFEPDDSKPIDVVEAFDYLSVHSSTKCPFSYLVVPNDSKLLHEREEAKTLVNNGQVLVREWVWDAACKKKQCRAIFTLAHELGHFILTVALGVQLSRVSDEAAIKPFEDPEWQADTFASEFLMPFDQCIGKTSEEISVLFNVSMSCAETRERKVNREIQKLCNEKK